jgi:hypothetical protein
MRKGAGDRLLPDDIYIIVHLILLMQYQLLNIDAERKQRKRVRSFFVERTIIC